MASRQLKPVLFCCRHGRWPLPCLRAGCCRQCSGGAHVRSQQLLAAHLDADHCSLCGQAAAEDVHAVLTADSSMCVLAGSSADCCIDCEQGAAADYAVAGRMYEKCGHQVLPPTLSAAQHSVGADRCPCCTQVAADNAVAVRMYEKCGYQVVGRTTDSPLHWIMQVGLDAKPHHLQAAPCNEACR